MSRSSACEAQVEPLAALVAVLVVCVAVGTFATARGDVLPEVAADAPADAVVSDAVDVATPSDSVVVDPGRLDASTLGPTGYDVAVTLTAGEREWTAGPSPPPDATVASQRVPVRVAADHVRPGRLTVEVWS